jgi:hypothetical protein
MEPVQFNLNNQPIIPPTGGNGVKFNLKNAPIPNTFDSRLINTDRSSKYDAGYNPLTMGNQEDYRSYKQGTFNK